MINNLLGQYVEEVRKIYGERLKSVILYGSYARGDFRPDSDIDIMILVDIKPIAKSDAHFQKWLGVYPFYTNVQKEGVELYGTA